MQDKLWYLKQFNILKELNPREMQLLEQKTNMNQISSKQMIYFVHDPSLTIYFLKKGRVKLVRVSSGGDEMILDIIKPGEMFGEIAITDEKMRDDIAISLEECILCSINSNDFAQIVQNNSHLNFRLTKLIGLRLKKFSRRLENLIFKNARQRLLDLFKELIDEYGQSMGEAIWIKNFLTHREIGEIIGLQRQTVTSLMNQLKEEEVIDFDRKKIIICDQKAFIQLCDKY